MSEWMRSRWKYKFPKKRGHGDLTSVAQFDSEREHQRIVPLSRVVGKNKKGDEKTDEGGQVQVLAVTRANYRVAIVFGNITHNWLHVLEKVL